MRWRTIEEVKVGKGDKICANIACGRNEGLEAMEVVFGYVEDGKKKDVLVKCVLCEKCEKKMRKARDTGKRRRRNRHRDKVNDDGKGEQTDEDARKRRRRHEEHGKRHRRHHDEDPEKRRQCSSKDMSEGSNSKDRTDGLGKTRPKESREH